MRMIKKTYALIIAVLLILLSNFAFALHIKGVEIPERIMQEASQQQLILNGAGLRSKFIFDIYVGALYLVQRSDSAEQILADASPKRIMMHFLYKKIEKEKMNSAWNEGFEENLSEAQFRVLESKIETFNSAFGETLEGDVVVIDFLADSTTRVTINKVEKARIKGTDFQRALLSVWLGESPVDGSLKRAMLGQQ